MYRQGFERILAALPGACEAVYGGRLVSLAVFGSVARGTMRPDSDIDLLLVANPLPDGRMERMAEFDAVEERLRKPLAEARAEGVQTILSPVFKTPEELRQGSFLFLDLTDQALILHDRGSVLRDYLEGLAARLRAMGARRVYKGGGYYWVLKPDYKPGDRIEL
ncbi:MAG: nucleotidyltransferase domain-containing protein [Pseudomonadota bacterium]